jgi:hypothetical protein
LGCDGAGRNDVDSVIHRWHSAAPEAESVTAQTPVRVIR